MATKQHPLISHVSNEDINSTAAALGAMLHVSHQVCPRRRDFYLLLLKSRDKAQENMQEEDKYTKILDELTNNE